MNRIVGNKQEEPSEQFERISEALHTGSPRLLTGLSHAALDELFNSLEAPVTVPEGRLKGHVMALAGTSWMPRFLRRLLAQLLGAAFLWSAKEFRGDVGSNILFGIRHGVRFGHYDISTQTGSDSKAVISLNYDIEQNWALLRRIRGELRFVTPNVLLGRMLWKTRQGYFTVMYFTLSRRS